MPFVEQNFISKTFIIQCIYFLDQYLCTLLRLTTVIKDNLLTYLLTYLYHASVSEIMRRQLHWLEMPYRDRFKLCTLVYRCLHGFAPHYLSYLCTPATVHAHLRSSVTLERSLSIPRTKTKTIGPRGFYFASSAAWNALPVHLRDPELSLNSFKAKLKTHFLSWCSRPTWVSFIT